MKEMLFSYNVKKSIIVITGSIAFLVGNTVPALAATSQTLNLTAPSANVVKSLDKNIKPLDLTSDEYDIKTLDDGSQEIVIKNPIKFLNEQNIPIPKEVKNVYVVVKLCPPKVNASNVTGKEISTNLQPQSQLSILEDVDKYGSPFYATNYNKLLVQANGSTGTLTATVAKSVNSTFSCSISVPVDKVSATVGFQVNKGYWVSASDSVPTNGKYTQLKAYEYDRVQAFEVYNIITQQTDAIGYAYEPYGATFVEYQS